MENIYIGEPLDVEKLKEEIFEVINNQIKKRESVFRKDLSVVIDDKINNKESEFRKEITEVIDKKVEQQESFFLENFATDVPDNLDLEAVKDDTTTKFVHIAKNFIDLKNETQNDLLKIKCQLDMYFQDQEEKHNLILNKVKVSNSKTDGIIIDTLTEMKNRVPDLEPLGKQLDKMMTCISDLQRNQLCYEQKLNDLSANIDKIQSTVKKDMLNLCSRLDKEKVLKDTSNVNITSISLETKKEEKVKDKIKEVVTKETFVEPCITSIPLDKIKEKTKKSPKKKDKKKEQIKNKKKKVIVKNKEELDEWNNSFVYTTKKYEEEKPIKKEDKISKFGILIYKLKGILKHDKQKNSNNKS